MSAWRDEGFRDAEEVESCAMGLKVSYISDEKIENDAQALLAGYARQRGTPIEAPIPIDDIIEKHLKIGIEFDDTHRLFGVPRSRNGFDADILGAIFFDQKADSDRRKPRSRHQSHQGRALSLHGSA